MVEVNIIDYLEDTLDVPVYAEEPENSPGTFVLVERTGSRTVDKLCTASIAVQSYAPTMYAAATLNESVKEAMDIDAIGALDVVAGCHLDTDYNFTDTSTKRYRYQAVFDLTYYQETEE